MSASGRAPVTGLAVTSLLPRLLLLLAFLPMLCEGQHCNRFLIMNALYCTVLYCTVLYLTVL